MIWIHTYLLNGKNFCTMQVPSEGSWVWKKILRLRVAATNLIKHKIGNGNSTSFWMDNWLPCGPLFVISGPLIIQDLNSSTSASVSETLSRQSWNCFLSSRRQTPTAMKRYMDLKRLIPPDIALNSQVHDSIVWLPSSFGVHSAKSAWDSLRYKGPVVNWHHVVWSPKSIPKCSFILWICILKRLPTRDKLQRWGLTNSLNVFPALAALRAKTISSSPALSHPAYGLRYSPLVSWKELPWTGILSFKKL
uniref:Reverse transcriptase zinc-binding domain-containing protein n=1 Tax=Davidia involucrata TaxID=16924 RepID=A0A5B7BG42_DAVIN